MLGDFDILTADPNKIQITLAEGLLIKSDKRTLNRTLEIVSTKTL